MKTLLITAALLVAVPAAAQESPMPMPTPEEMQAMMALAAPGPEHDDLARLAGTWTMQSTFNMGGPPMKVTGQAVNTLVLGGRFLKSESKGKGVDGAMDIESLSLYGFDRRTGEFTVVGFDTLGTYYVTAAGKRDAGASEVSMQGSVEEQMGGKSMRMDYDMVLRWIDADSYVSEIIFHMPQGDMKIAEMTFTRVK